MGVITISSELGTGGVEIGARVAADLGYTLVDEETSDRILRLYGLTKFRDLYESGPSLVDLIRVENLVIISMYNEILEGLARRGGTVILSRVGFAVLGGFADVFNVRVVAPAEQRIGRIMAAEGLADASAAEERLHDDDAAEQRFVERFYNRHREDAAGYGLVVDTGSMSVEDAAQRIMDAARAAFAAPAAPAAPGSARTTAGIEVDPVLASAIEEIIAAPIPGAAD